MRSISNFAAWLRGTHRRYRKVFAGEAGRAVLADMLDRAAPAGRMEVPGDPTGTLRNVARRDFVIEVAGFAGLSEADLEAKIAAMKRSNADGEDDEEDGREDGA